MLSLFVGPLLGRQPRRLCRAMIALLCYTLVGSLLVGVPSASAQTTNLALNRPVTVSSTENAGAFPPSAAVDGNSGTRWASTFSDPQWIAVDLGSVQSIGRVVLRWEAAYGRAYQIQVSNDGSAWSSIYSTTTGDGGVDDLTVSGSGRYVRMYGTARGTAYGYSLWELEVYGGTAATPTRTSVPTATNISTPTATRTPVVTPSSCGTANVALNRTVTASSIENAGTPATAAVDGNAGTRWSSAPSDPQWLQVDLGASAPICRVVLRWEAAYGRAYQVQVSGDGSSWSTLYSTAAGDGGVDDLTVSGSGRYLRVYGTQRGTAYGYSLWELEVYSSGVLPTPTVTPQPTATPGPVGPVDFGPNVAIFDPSMSSAAIQAKLNAVFAVQESNQFGMERNALLFKPGTYAIDASIGFNTQIAGLGFSPNDVTINGYVRAEADWFGDNGTQNFWRFAENMTVVPPDGNNRWAVSQAAPFRRMHVRGQLQLDPRGHGWSSGGFIADSKVDAQVFSGSQQQYFARSSQIGSWSNCVWNCVFVGVAGAPAQSFPTPPYTNVASVPLIREKPFLYVDGAGNYNVFVPALRANTSSTTWYGQTPQGTSLPISQFYIVKPGSTATDMNDALAQGKNLLITPGVYHLNQTINVTRANTVILGMGLATFIPDNGVVAVKVADVDGVKIAGLLIDAGTTNSPVLIEVGPPGSSASHAANPTSLHDVFARIGGAVAGKATLSLVVNSNNVIIDHTWLWRGDHGDGIGWAVNTADTGLVVNGNDVTAYGLFVEHYQKYQVIWNGNGGRTYMFQNEMPYDPPNQASWMNGAGRGYAAYKVSDSVTTHEAWGVGSYCYFNVDPTVVADRGFEVPNKPGVRFHGLLTVSLGGNGVITNVVNTTGGPAQGVSTIPSYVTSYQ